MNNTRAALLTGANMGNRYENLTQARLKLEQMLGPVCLASAIYSTQAWGGKSTAAYLNQVLVFEVKITAQELLDICLKVELELGRVRGEERWTDRTMDIDILVFGEQQQCPQLQLPHPRLHERRFALVPLMEVWPQWLHPDLKRTTAELLEACTDTLEVVKSEEVKA